MLALKYALFALIATGVNLLFQWGSFQLHSGCCALYVALFVGTLAGLVAKYLLDKRWIFYHTPKDKKEDAQKFMLYTLMGVFTTVIFWGTEMLFHVLFQWPGATYVGGAIGLSIGYVIKYFLDKKYVFIERQKGQ